MSLFRHPSLLLRALSALLSYPDPELRAAMPEVIEALRGQRKLKADTRQQLVALASAIAEGDELDVQGRYVDLFDRGRRTSLNLFEHVHGDGRKRGPAMLELRQRYNESGMQQIGDDLPDHLPLLLEYLSCRGRAEVRETLVEIAHILRPLGNTLVKRNSPYAVVMVALLELAGEKGLDADAPVPPADNFDRTWQERPAFTAPEPNPALVPESRRA